MMPVRGASCSHQTFHAQRLLTNEARAMVRTLKLVADTGAGESRAVPNRMFQSGKSGTKMTRKTQRKERIANKRIFSASLR